MTKTAETELIALESVARGKTIIWVAMVSIVVLTPFSFMNLLHHHYLIAVGLFLILAILAFNAWVCLRNRYYPLITLLALVPAITLSLALVFKQQGIIGALWCYPAVISFYFMLPERQAWLANGLIMVMALPFSWIYLDHSLASRVIATLLCVSAFSMIFLRVIIGQQRDLHDLAMTDSLTGLSNRVLLHSSLERAQQQFSRSQMPMSLIMLDLDHFKRINDEQGHAEGDRVLKGVGKLLSVRMRGSDKVFRLGGEEFLILLFNTNLGQASLVAESLRSDIESSSFLPDITVTASAGVAELMKGEHWREWMKRSDDKLYQAKKEGRNRVISY